MKSSDRRSFINRLWQAKLSARTAKKFAVEYQERGGEYSSHVIEVLTFLESAILELDIAIRKERAAEELDDA